MSFPLSPPVRFATSLTILLLAVAAAYGEKPNATADLYVAPNGQDSWSGELTSSNEDGSDGPLASLAGARDAVRKLRAAAPAAKPIRVLIRGGTYRVDEPVVFTAEDSSTQEAPITYEAWPGEKPIISGGVPITGWKKESDGPLWTTVLPEVKEDGWHPRELFVDGRRCMPARSPNEGTFRAVGPGVPYKDRNQARRDPQAKKSVFYQGDDRFLGLTGTMLLSSSTIRGRRRDIASSRWTQRNAWWSSPRPAVGPWDGGRRTSGTMSRAFTPRWTLPANSIWTVALVC